MEVKIGQNLFTKNYAMQKNKNFSVTNISYLKQDTVSFKGSTTVVKKNDFKGIDLVVVDKYKAPIEKFKTTEDLQTWCGQKLTEMNEKILNNDFEGRNEETRIQRKAILKEWSDYVLKENGGYNKAVKFLILDSITKDLKKQNDILPPVLNKGVLADCIFEIETNINEYKKQNKIYNFNLNKLYQTKLANFYLEDTDTGETETKWVKIPSKKHDTENFEANVDKLKTLSYKSWCTKSYNAKPYLEKGDFHVFLEKGQSKIGVRFEDNKIVEIQGEFNDSNIPLDYFDEVTDYLKKNNFILNKDAKEQFKEAKERKFKVSKIKKEIGLSIENKEVAKILNYFGIETKKDEKGFLTISEYKQPSDNLRFNDLGINENDLLKKIKHIEKNANFIGSNATSTGALEIIDGYFYLDNFARNELKTPKLRVVGERIIGTDKQIQEISKNLELLNSCNLKDKKEELNEIVDFCNGDTEKLFYYFGFNFEKDKDGFYTIEKYEQPNEYVSFKDIGVDENKLFEKVKRIKGDASFKNPTLKTLKNLESVGGNLIIGSQIEDLGNLKEVGGHFSGYQSKVSNLGCLKSVGGNLYVNNKLIESLGDLEKVGESLFLAESKKLTTLGKLKHVGKSLELTDSNVVDLGELEYIGEDAWFNKTKIKNVSKLKFVGEYIYHRDGLLKNKDFSHIKRNHNPFFYFWDKIYYTPRDKEY